MSSKKGKIRLYLVLKNRLERVTLKLNNILYMPNSFCNLVNLRQINNNEIFYNNKNKILYIIKNQKTFAHT